MKVFRATNRKALNLAYDDLVQQRAQCHLTVGDVDAARDELKTLKQDLAKRGVNPSVLKGIEEYAISLVPAATSTGARMRGKARGSKAKVVRRPRTSAGGSRRRTR